MYLMSNAPECIGPSAPTCKTEHTHVKQGLHLKTNKTPKLKKQTNKTPKLPTLIKQTHDLIKNINLNLSKI